jgi:hypothetical protein
MVLHEVFEVVVPGGKILRVVSDVPAGAKAVGVGAVVSVFNHLETNKENYFLINGTCFSMSSNFSLYLTLRERPGPNDLKLFTAIIYEFS